MKKKQLSRRQLHRIRKMQEGYAHKADDNEGDITDTTLGPEQKGLVVSHFGQQLDIESLEGDKAGIIHRCFQRANLEPLVAGDHVIFQEGEPMGIVLSCLPRRSELKRPSSLSGLRPVAANIDKAIIVIAPVPEPFSNLIDRYLVALENSKIDPLIVLNKCDLITEDTEEKLQQLLSIYQSIGYPVMTVSSKTGEGLDELSNQLNTFTSIVVGQSGVGKSALVNALLPGVNTLEGSLSQARDKGRHTTTSARVFHFPSGGDLIDSPGIREFGMEHLSEHEVLDGFREFRPWLSQCQFRDCRHQQEPGCKLKEAVQQGKIHPKRLENYHQIIASIA